MGVGAALRRGNQEIWDSYDRRDATQLRSGSVFRVQAGDTAPCCVTLQQQSPTLCLTGTVTPNKLQTRYSISPINISVQKLLEGGLNANNPDSLKRKMSCPSFHEATFRF